MSQITYLILFKNLFFFGRRVDMLVTFQFFLIQLFDKWYPIKPVPPTIRIFVFFFNDLFFLNSILVFLNLSWCQHIASNQDVYMLLNFYFCKLFRVVPFPKKFYHFLSYLKNLAQSQKNLRLSNPHQLLTSP